MAIIPFSVPANLAESDSEHPGLANELAWKVHSHMLGSETVPIVEVLNREDWPGKKEEFFTGNFGAISMSREAGYDLMLVGYLEPTKTPETMTAYTKIMDVESGITIWYGKTDVHTRRPSFDSTQSTFWLEDDIPSQRYRYTTVLVDDLAHCIVRSCTSEANNENDS